MKVELKPGDKITICFEDSDGEFEISFNPDSIVVKSELPGNVMGGSGVIYEEKFGEEDQDFEIA